MLKHLRVLGASSPYYKKEHGEPEGQRLESHTNARSLMERVFPRNQLHPLHIGRGLGKVDASSMLQTK